MRTFREIMNLRGMLPYLILGIIQFSFLCSGCKKFLDQKPDKSEVVPQTLNELQTLLDNAQQVMNNKSPNGLAELLADNYYFTSEYWKSRTASSSVKVKAQAYNYIWDPQTIAYDDAWNYPYQNPIYYSNIVLDQLPLIGMNPTEGDLYKNIKGSALFYRAFAFQELAQLYCQPYGTNNDAVTGIVLRLTSSVSEKSSLATLEQTYNRIIDDFKEAASLLPEKALVPTRPSKVAAYAALARTYLSKRDYINAGIYAKLTLEKQSTLMDYNTLMPIGTPPINTFNPEVIFHNIAQTAGIMNGTAAKIDSILYQSYSNNDLRKQLFFVESAGAYNFQGSYDGNFESPVSIFDGLATDEIYLIKAECDARDGHWMQAIDTLNALLTKRWIAGSFIPLNATNESDALNKILTERRKELVFRGLRWSDIRRLNMEGANITLRRVIDGVDYTLPPNDLKSVMLFPLSEILFSGIQQNPR